jgi:lipopolysaccharide export LptBFGC system permease protein LptF
MKKVLAFLIIGLSIFLIYYFNKDTSIYYVALGDNSNDYYQRVMKNLKDIGKLEEAKFQFLEKNYKLNNISKQINTNVTINDQAIKNALIKADLVTIYFDSTDILEKEGDFAYVDKKAKELKKTLKLLKMNCKEKIILIGPDDSYSGSLKYLNKVFRKIANKYNVTYIKILPDEDISDEIIEEVNF